MDSLTSASWYRVAARCFRVSPHARLHRQRFRGDLWFVTRNPATGRVHRLSPAAWDFVARMDGRCTTHAAWEACVARHGDEAPTQDEAIRLLSTLAQAGLLQGDGSPGSEFLEHAKRQRRAEKRSRRNLISFRVTLFDPDALLDRMLPWVRRSAQPVTGLAIGMAVVAGLLGALMHTAELRAAAQDLLTPTALMAMWFAYPLVKAAHELGHALAVKLGGGSVHEVGVQFLVFVPVPYVDASASAVFENKWARMGVAGAGLAVEAVIACLSVLLWTWVEPGAVRQVAYSVAILTSVSTLVFNGNPLMRFDGYHMLVDAIELPNLASRSRTYLGSWVKRRLLGLRSVSLPRTTPSEARWLLGYGVASGIYQVGVLLGIALFVAGKFFVLGAALALYVVASRVVRPTAQALAWLAFDLELGDRRPRAVAGAATVLVGAAVFLFVVPLPHHSRIDGVTVLSPDGHVRAGGPGFVTDLLVRPHDLVEPGAPLLRMHDPAHHARLRRLRARVREIRMQRDAALRNDRVESEVLSARLAHAKAELERARERGNEELVVSRTGGRFVLATPVEPIGLYLQQGDAIGAVVHLAEVAIRVAVPEHEAAWIRRGPRETRVRFDHAPARSLAARVVREVPAARDRLPSPVLGTMGGGSIVVDPADPEGITTLDPVFQFELATPNDSAVAIGERVHIRFDHGPEPLGYRGLRAARRLFLRRLGV